MRGTLSGLLILAAALGFATFYVCLFGSMMIIGTIGEALCDRTEVGFCALVRKLAPHWRPEAWR